MTDNFYLTGTKALERKIILGDEEEKSSFRKNQIKRRVKQRDSFIYGNKKKLKKKKKKKWIELLQNLTFKQPNEKSDDEAIITPGNKFWYYLGLAILKKRKKKLKENGSKRFKVFKGPKIRIPHTLASVDDSSDSTKYWLWTDPQTGETDIIEDANDADFLRHLELAKELGSDQFKAKLEIREREWKEKELDLDVMRKENERLLIDFEQRRKKEFFLAYRKRMDDFETNTDVYSIEKWNQIRSTSSGLSSWSLVQDFIYPKGKKVSVTRMVYHTRHNERHISNFAYNMRNTVRLDSDKRQNKEKATLEKEKMWSFEVTSMSGASLVNYEIQARNLVNFMERAYPVRIKRIILDFITGRDGLNYLFNVKYIDIAKIPENLRAIGNRKKKSKNELTCSVYCKLCGLIFKKDEASKTLTYKLLWELSQHLKKRGKELKNIEISHSSTRPCRVCDLCYMVVVSEHELIELEQQFARAQNIPIKDPYLRVPIEKKAKHRPALLSETLKQWRFMMYLEYLFFEEDDVNMFEELNVDLSNIHLQIKISNMKNDFFIKLEKADKRRDSELRKVSWKGREVYKLKLLRVYYFFSESIEINNFLSETELQIRLTHTKDWNNYIAHGSTKTLSNFQRYRESGQKHESKIYLFFDNAKYCTLKMLCGLVCDGDFNTASMNLHKYNGIYFPDEDFYNCNIFPEEWIEIFKEDHDGNKSEESEESGDQEKKIQPYTPICTVSELKKMLQGNVRSTKYSNVRPKTDTRLDVDALWVQLNELKITNGFEPSQRYRKQYGNFTVGGSSHTNYRIASGKYGKKPRRPQTSIPHQKRTKKQRATSSKVKQLIEQNAEIEKEFKDDVKRIIEKNGDEDMELFNIDDLPKLNKNELEDIYNDKEGSKDKTKEDHISKLSKESKNHEEYLSRRTEREIEEKEEESENKD